jgi:UPF0176 protein
LDTKIKVTAFYKFIKLTPENLSTVKSRLESAAETNGISGLIILAQEGANGTVAGSSEGLDLFKIAVKEILSAERVIFKDSWTSKNPFRRFKIKVRDEIVSLGKPDIFPEQQKNHHLTPSEWTKVLEQEDVVLIDTRNAIDPNIKAFNEFPQYLDDAKIPKEKKVLMYCTGGIRCEKALIEMQKRGYENVYQLEGGILKYLEEYPQGKFKGECFVFDHRVSVDGNLQPSKKYHLCAHCGDPGEEKLTCANCGSLGKICARCAQNPLLRTCSKNCSYHLSGCNPENLQNSKTLRE